VADREKLIELAGRVEALTGPDREVDALIGFEVGTLHLAEGYAPRDVFGAGCRAYDGPAYSGSIDDAMTLVPEGWLIDNIAEAKWPDRKGRPWWCALSPRDPVKARHKGWPHQCAEFDCATPALALTAAALRARAAEQEGR
jgi:hypothetical protein